jgi:hypothetical protein
VRYAGSSAPGAEPGFTSRPVSDADCVRSELAMACPACLKLKATLLRLEKKHSEVLRRLIFDVVRGEAPELRQLRIAEREARLDLEMALAEMAAHQRLHHRK